MKDDRVQSFRGQHAIAERIKKTLYYGRIKEPKEVMECPSLPLTEVVVDMFEKAMKQKCPENRSLEVFDLNYASTVSDKACISPCSVVLAIIYMERLKRKNPDYLRTVSPCDLFLVSMMVASKYLFDDGEDEEVFNDEWAASGYIELKELNRREREFLAAIDWDLYVAPDEFFTQLRAIEVLVTWNQTRKRGSEGLTYNELVSLAFDDLSLATWLQCSDGILKMLAVAAVSYAAVVMSVFGATLLACSFHVMVSNSVSPSNTEANSPAINLTSPEINTIASRLCEPFSGSSCSLPSPTEIFLPASVVDESHESERSPTRVKPCNSSKNTKAAPPNINFYPNLFAEWPIPSLFSTVKEKSAPAYFSLQLMS